MVGIKTEPASEVSDDTDESEQLEFGSEEIGKRITLIPWLSEISGLEYFNFSEIS